MNATDSPLPSAPPGKRRARASGLGQARALVLCFLRSYLVAAGFNAHGMQNLGFIYAIEPGLRRIYRDSDDLRAARERYITHYNTHPFWTPLLLGIFLHEEENIRRGLVPARALTSIKDTASYTLSAIGDSVFTGTLLPLWAIGSACLVVSGHTGLALFFTILLFALLQVFRLYTFVLGLRNGMTALAQVRRFRLIDWGQRFKIANAVLLAVFLRLVAPEGFGAEKFVLMAAALGAAVWCLVRKHVPRVLLAVLLLGFWWWLATSAW